VAQNAGIPNNYFGAAAIWGIEDLPERTDCCSDVMTFRRQLLDITGTIRWYLLFESTAE